LDLYSFLFQGVEPWRKDRRGMLPPMIKDTLLMVMTMRTQRLIPPDLWIPERNEEDTKFERGSVEAMYTVMVIR